MQETINVPLFKRFKKMLPDMRQRKRSRSKRPWRGHLPTSVKLKNRLRVAVKC
jgi:hypothetical protein